MNGINVPWIIVFYLWAFFLAGVEIEIEGGRGWAERLPTWWRRRGPIARVYGMFMAGRPLTGFHVFQLPLPLIVLQLPFLFGLHWTVGRELRTIAAALFLGVAYDFLWFVLNPAYTVRGFRRGKIWWFSGPWLGPFPIDYYLGIGVSIVVAALGWLVDGEPGLLTGHLWLVGGMIALTALTIPFAPLYHRWYASMRRGERRDDRRRVETYGPPSPAAVWTGEPPELTDLTAARRRPRRSRSAHDVEGVKREVSS